MKKIICLVLAILMCFLAGCAEVVETNAELESQYSYYTASAKKIMDELQLTQEQADAAFKILVQCGMDKEVNYIFDDTDAEGKDYYEVYYGTKSFDVYFKDGAIETVKQYNKVLYPENHESTNEGTTSGETATASGISITEAAEAETATKKTIATEGKSSTKEQTTKKPQPITTEKATEKKYTVILNTKTHVYHTKECRSVGLMDNENRSSMTGTIVEIEAAGYRLCGNCKR